MSAAAVEGNAVRSLRREDLPELLRQIHDPPRRLFLRGSASADVLEQAAVAIVGARACSPYGSQVARMLGRELAAAGLIVVSGLARGVDGEAHRGALEAGGITVAAERPAMIRLRAGKRHGAGSTAGSYSETTRPRSQIRRASSAWTAG